MLSVLLRLQIPSVDGEVLAGDEVGLGQVQNGGGDLLGGPDPAQRGVGGQSGQPAPFVIARPVRTLVVAIRSPFPPPKRFRCCDAETRDADCHVAYGSSQ